METRKCLVVLVTLTAIGGFGGRADTVTGSDWNAGSECPPGVHSIYCQLPLLISADTSRNFPIEGDWVMHLYMGARLFDDQVHLERDNNGKLSGTLNVPNRFTVPLRNILVTEETISFNIEA